MKEKMSIKDVIIQNGYEDVIVIDDDVYDDALIGISEDERAIYSYEKMVECLMKEDNLSEIDAMDMIDYNVIRSLPYVGNKAPIIMYNLIV